MTALASLEAVTKAYPGCPPVLTEVSLRVEAGEALALTGPSGSGKSTLLNLLGGLDLPTVGRVVIDGADTRRLDTEGLASLRRSTVGFVFQDHHLLGGCTVLENVLVPTLAVRWRATRDDVARARHLLDRVGLGGREGSRPAALSGGERQRVAVVRALINHPRLLLADEPTGALDGDGSIALADLLVELNREQGVALVVASHSTAFVRRMPRVLRLERARLAEEPVSP